MSVSQRLDAVRERLRVACEAAGRSPEEVKLIAVSKTFGVEPVAQAADAGQSDFGESYAQELRDKTAALVDRRLRWHFIGRIQSNKARYIGPVAYRVHALEHVRHAQALLDHAPEGLDALMAVNIGEEGSKSGVAPDAVRSRARELASLPGLRLRGLMCLPPFTEDPEGASPYFERMAHLLSRLRDDGHEVGELSMGMSHDFEVAVRHGATWVRVGTAIFGARG